VSEWTHRVSDDQFPDLWAGVRHPGSFNNDKLDECGHILNQDWAGWYREEQKHHPNEVKHDELQQLWSLAIGIEGNSGQNDRYMDGFQSRSWEWFQSIIALERTRTDSLLRPIVVSWFWQLRCRPKVHSDSTIKCRHSHFENAQKMLRTRRWYWLQSRD
jgi:hypothetical protein